MTQENKLQNRIKAALAEAGIEADDSVCGKLAVYMTGVLERNERINLTAITDEEQFVCQHIVDSTAMIRVPGYEEALSVCDVGTGAGFPGIVLAALSPDKEITLIDSLAKRLNVIEELAGEAGVENIRLIHSRAEDAGHIEGVREAFDIVTARAVAALPVLAELCVPLVRKGGSFIAFKAGTDIDKEVKESKHAANILGVSSTTIQDAGVPGMNHVFVVMKKTGKTPAKYPRKAGDPARNPL